MEALSSPAVANAAVRILLVDDEPKLRETLAEGLRLESWHVTTAGCGEEALALLATQTFDLLVVDWMLPDFDGLEILRHARALSPAMPVLMITARNAMADRRTALGNGVSDYVTKPFGFTELLTRCENLLRRKSGADASAADRAADGWAPDAQRPVA